MDVKHRDLRAYIRISSASQISSLDDTNRQQSLSPTPINNSKYLVIDYTARSFSMDIATIQTLFSYRFLIVRFMIRMQMISKKFFIKFIFVTVIQE